MKLLLFVSVITIVIFRNTPSLIPTTIPRIIINADTGPDDAFGLLVLLHAEKIGQVKVEGIICALGNSDLNHTCNNAARVLSTFNRTDIPIFRGSSKPIVALPKNLTGQFFFGKDGFGDLDGTTNNYSNMIQDEPAASALHRLATSYPNEIVFVSLAPLTALGISILISEQVEQKLKEIWIMGGNYKGPGNIVEEAEFNIFIDPESANVVLNAKHTPITLLTWQTCLQVGIPLDWRFNELGKNRSPFMDLLNKVEYKVYANTSLETDWLQCDAFTAIAAVYPEIMLKQCSHKVGIELHDVKTRGKLLTDDANPEKAKVRILEKVDSERIKDILLEAANNL